MKKKLLSIISTISLVLVMALSPLFIQGLNSKCARESLSTQTRTMEISNQKIDYESVFNEFEDTKFDTQGNFTNFEGTKTFNLKDFEEFDLVSETNIDTSIKVKYNYTYDSELHIIILSAKLIDEDGLEFVDEMLGVPFIDENGDFDCVFDCDGENVLLSELRNAEMLENCGLFKNLCKKVAKIAKKVAATVKTAAKAVGTFVHENADVIVPLAIGVIGGLTGGAAVPVLLAGTAAGALIDGTKTAIETYKETGRVDWVATGISAGIGAAVGLVATYTGYNIGSALRPETDNRGGSSSSGKGKQYNSYKEFMNENGSANNSSVKYGTAGTNGKYEWHHIVEQNQVGNNGISAQNIYSTNNTISLGYDTHRQISAIYSTNIENLGKYSVDGLQQIFNNVQKGQTVRNYLSTLSFEQQYEIGIEILRLLGVKI